MRPIVKAKVGSAVTYVDSQGHTVNHVVQEYYADYKEAKLPLVGNLGPYCSYCERQLLASDLAVEHIEPKSKNGKELQALELPGLWNGAMSDWITIFVEVPLGTFNPVKTVNDLLREQHQ